MTKNLCLIGVGSLGGHIAQKMQSHCDSIYAIDPDIVERRNLRNSIYKKADIGIPKVEALKNHVSECNIIPIQSKAENIDIPKADLVIDCRDVANRNLTSDVKFNIIGKHLRVNCEPVVNEMDKPGQYLVELKSKKVAQAGELARRILMSDVIFNIQQKHALVHVPIASNSIRKSINDIICYDFSCDERSCTLTIANTIYTNHSIFNIGGA